MCSTSGKLNVDILIPGPQIEFVVAVFVVWIWRLRMVIAAWLLCEGCHVEMPIISGFKLVHHITKLLVRMVMGRHFQTRVHPRFEGFEFFVQFFLFGCLFGLPVVVYRVEADGAGVKPLVSTLQRQTTQRYG